MYEVINGRQIKIKDPPGFYDGGLTEADYLKYVQESQEYIKACNLEDRETKICDKSAYSIWGDPGRAVAVEKVGRRYKVTNNGHHRAYIANKYNLKLLVYVDEDVLPDKHPIF